MSPFRRQLLIAQPVTDCPDFRGGILLRFALYRIERQQGRSNKKRREQTPATMKKQITPNHNQSSVLRPVGPTPFLRDHSRMNFLRAIKTCAFLSLLLL